MFIVEVLVESEDGVIFSQWMFLEVFWASMLCFMVDGSFNAIFMFDFEGVYWF